MFPKLHKYMLHGDLGCFCFVEGIFDGPAISFYKAIEFGVVRAESLCLKQYLSLRELFVFGTEGLLIVDDHFLGLNPRTNSSLRQLMKVLDVVEIM